MLEDFFVPFFGIMLAEFGDKTQLILLSLSSKTKNHYSLFVAAMGALALSSALAILLGSFVTALIPMYYIRLAAGLLFIGLGISMFLPMLFKTHDNDKQQPANLSLISVFTLILMSEMGDKSQLAVASLATVYNSLLVFVGTICAFAILSASAIYLAKMLSAEKYAVPIHYLSAVLFVLIGLSFFFS